MLTIRLSRTGRRNRPFYRIVLTEHTKPVKSGYIAVMGRFDPLHHTMEAKEQEIKERIMKGAKLSERVAKLLYNKSKDPIYQKFFTYKNRQKKVKNPDKYANKG